MVSEVAKSKYGSYRAVSFISQGYVIKVNRMRERARKINHNDDAHEVVRDFVEWNRVCLVIAYVFFSMQLKKCCSSESRQRESDPKYKSHCRVQKSEEKMENCVYLSAKIPLVVPIYVREKNRRSAQLEMASDFYIQYFI